MTKLQEKMRDIRDTHQISNCEQLYAYLKANPSQIDELISLADKHPCLYFEPKTFDGRYCLERDNNEQEYEIFWQERGDIIPSTHRIVKEKSMAMAEVLFPILRNL